MLLGPVPFFISVRHTRKHSHTHTHDTHTSESTLGPKSFGSVSELRAEGRCRGACCALLSSSGLLNTVHGGPGGWGSAVLGTWCRAGMGLFKCRLSCHFGQNCFLSVALA